ncbi:DEAD-domain-containing protein [Terfezia boudieri ATCC MYA-4762]|uniref:DEAD-domain-containing protein n=1 Tax=Terfezia boudieri ATCC MYA-4762 TaxID=1051890 RepID=A0A3N4LU19_9PEZI|nr:DEAD-domain-containing protein [Terfezia boudieri ATCC MYA-4762]
MPTDGTNDAEVMPPKPIPSSFASLGVNRWLVDSLTAMAIRKPTPIQAACIGPILEGRDCIGGSRTGSGKTVAFAAPILQKWAEDPFGIFALILTPTRELALQMAEQFHALGSPQNIKLCLLIGGADMRTQAISLAQRPHVVIATPGRLADHIRSSGEDTICGLRRTRFVVLDEADRLLTDSFAEDLSECLDVVPSAEQGRQTLLFTATMTDEIRFLKDKPPVKGMKPVYICEIDTDQISIPPTLAQTYLFIPITVREAYLHTLLSTPRNENKSAIIFTNRTYTANLLTQTLKLLGHRVTALHSDLPQRERIDSLGRFRAQAARLLIATDVASRGLDIPVVELVINYDVPRDPDDYIHRVGRTARAGKKGESVTIITEHDVLLIQAIEERAGKKMEKYEDDEGVSLEGRVVRETLQVVSEKKREAIMNIEEGRNEKGKKRRRGKALDTSVSRKR